MTMTMQQRVDSGVVRASRLKGPLATFATRDVYGKTAWEDVWARATDAQRREMQRLARAAINSRTYEAAWDAAKHLYAIKDQIVRPEFYAIRDQIMRAVP